jgi:hypothetical protein
MYQFNTYLVHLKDGRSFRIEKVNEVLTTCQFLRFMFSGHEIICFNYDVVETYRMLFTITQPKITMSLPKKKRK